LGRVEVGPTAACTAGPVPGWPLSAVMLVLLMLGVLLRGIVWPAPGSCAAMARVNGVSICGARSTASGTSTITAVLRCCIFMLLLLWVMTIRMHVGMLRVSTMALLRMLLVMLRIVGIALVLLKVFSLIVRVRCIMLLLLLWLVFSTASTGCASSCFRLVSTAAAAAARLAVRMLRVIVLGVCRCSAGLSHGCGLVHPTRDTE